MSKTSLLSYNVKIRLGTNLLRRLSNEALIPFMTIYLAKNGGVTFAGIIITFILLSGIVSSLYGGHLSDIFGRKKILLYTESCHVMSMLGMLIAYYMENIWVLVGFYFLKNIFLTFGTSSGEALLIDSSRSEGERRKIYNWQYWLNNLSIPLGTLLGAIFYQSSFTYSFLLSIFCAIFVFSAYLTLDDTQCKRDHNLRSIFSSYSIVFKDTVYIRLILSCLLVACLDFQLVGYIAIRLSTEFHTKLTWLHNVQITGVDMLTVLRTVVILSIVLFTFPIMYFLKINDMFKVRLGYCFYTLGLMGLAVSNNFYLLIISVLVMNIGEILFFSPRQVLMASLLPEASRGKYLSVFHLQARLGNILAALILMVSPWFGKYGIMCVYFLLGATSLYLLLKVFNGKPSLSEPDLKAVVQA
jgi:MFS transporter, DHA1 family, multidrug resistance protein B